MICVLLEAAFCGGIAWGGRSGIFFCGGRPEGELSKARGITLAVPPLPSNGSGYGGMFMSSSDIRDPVFSIGDAGEVFNMVFSLFTGIEMGLEELLMGTWVSRSVAVSELSPLADKNEVTSRSSAVVTASLLTGSGWFLTGNSNSLKLPRFRGG